MRISIHRFVASISGIAVLLPASATNAAPSCRSQDNSYPSIHEGAFSSCSSNVYGYVHTVRLTCTVKGQENHYTVDGPWKLVGTNKDDQSIAWRDWWDTLTWHQSIVTAVNTLSSEEQALLFQGGS
ncbi:hypothetical protein ACQP1V_19825 [Microtetraspora malaysiensis]|uniref:hypothetical protein n=1 Tax=Microtetraspora malaysiensis TaxID=161358 RepID=UPI003D8D98BD